MDERYHSYLEQIKGFIPKDRIYTDDLRCLTWGTDAGFYRAIPKIVVRSKDEQEVAQLLRLAHKMKLPVTFRAAGTSLSGQAISNSIMIVAGKHWEKYSLNDDASEIKLQPGIVGQRVDEILSPYGRVFSPDPASKRSAMVGGIVINNASGMGCGTHANSDKILRSMRIVFADGTILDTGDQASKDEFARTHPDFIKKIEELRDRVCADEQLTARIHHKYSIKNVMGLNLRPFVAYTDPFEIITHLLVGSEGTLGFASEFTMTTAKKFTHTASAMIYFHDMRTASEAVVALKSGPVECAEMLDKTSLEAVNDPKGKGLTALLLRTSTFNQEQLDANIREITSILSTFDTVDGVKFTSDPAEYSKYWAIRSGLFPSVGGNRPLGTTVIIEDVAFHIDDLPNATVDLSNLLEEYDYKGSCIYGHALEGNYHFIISQKFDTEQDVSRYTAMMNAVVDLVVDKYDGSLKAEHGTGRNMAPFVKREWGEKAFNIMREVKQLFDPDNLLNPGVIFNDDPLCYIKDVKALPLTNVHVDKCIECGFCEVNCLSCGFTLSSRQRIVAQREITHLRQTGQDPARLARLEQQYLYDGLYTCAADGLCATSCPMNINTGDLTHDLKNQIMAKNAMANKVGQFVADHLDGARTGLKVLLHAATFAQNVIGDEAVNTVGKAFSRIGVPLWTSAMPRPRKQRVFSTFKSEKKVVYFPSCLNQTMGYSAHGTKADLVDTVVQFLNKAGWEVIFPDGLEKQCCGQIWESKGMPEIADAKSAQLEDVLLKASQNGTYPIIFDQSPCLNRMLHFVTKIQPLELMAFVHDYVMEDLDFHQTDEPVSVHLTCSTRKMGLNDKLITLAQKCSTQVLIPEEVGCCGFAGDKGFTHPELNAYALRKLKPQIQAKGVVRGFSNSRTCEIGLTTNSGIPYQSLIYLVNECTTAKRAEYAH